MVGWVNIIRMAWELVGFEACGEYFKQEVLLGSGRCGWSVGWLEAGLGFQSWVVQEGWAGAVWRRFVVNINQNGTFVGALERA